MWINLVTHFSLQEQAIYENIGYPDYIVSDNTTKLEKIYAEVRRLRISAIVAVCFQCIIHSKRHSNATCEGK
jgi:hypothetical protein